MLGLESFDKWEGDYKEGARSMKIDSGIMEGHYLLVHSNIIPTPSLAAAVKSLEPGQFLSHPVAGAIAFHFNASDVTGLHKIKVRETITYEEDVPRLVHSWDIFQQNDLAIRLDFDLLTKGRRSAPISPTNQVNNEAQVFIEEGARVEFAIINAVTGPVYIGKNAEIMEGSCIRGPLALGEQSVIKMGARIYGATTIGPYCIAGGEIKNSVLMGYSNKAHDGYLGDGVIGEWCNIGAGSSASNVKNNAGEIIVYAPASEGGKAMAGIKCGILMGDYSRSSINSSFNTGTVVGVSCSVFGSGLLPKYIPHFSWGAEGIRKYEYEKAIRDIGNWKRLKDASLTPQEENILKYIYDNY